ncbi:hypothetical protein KW787_01985 [Candidatus Pacearchaeota archaeon]|nr:hypothetical protein [Candidatus Pacearchaeota archaeon]
MSVETDISQETQTLHDKLNRDGWVIYGTAIEEGLPLMLSHLSLDLERKICSRPILRSLFEVVKGGKYENFSLGPTLSARDLYIAYIRPAEGNYDENRLYTILANTDTGNLMHLRGRGLLGSYHHKD